MPRGERLRLGYACTWWTPRAATWSYTANRLRAALDAHADVVDVETQRSLPLRAVEAAAGRVSRSAWQYSRFERAMVDRRARTGVRRGRPDAVLEIADVDTPQPVPWFPYQDMTVALGLGLRDTPAGRWVNLLPAPRSRLDALADRGIARLREATGVLAMSAWLRDDMVARGVDGARVHVVHAGVNSSPAAVRDPSRAPEGRLLFVGADFLRKGGDAVVAAAELLRRGGIEVRLTVAGPPRWPLPDAPPPWVDFLGTVPSARVGALLAEHDVFVMPSRFEAYGIVFVEALAAGLPCVAHAAFAMPELIRHGHTGLLVPEVRADLVADAVAAVLADPGFLSRAAAERATLVERHSWDAVAARVVDIVGAGLR